MVFHRNGPDPVDYSVRDAGSFEGQTTIAVGVRGRVPFRVFTVLDRGGHYRSVVLDLAPAP